MEILLMDKAHKSDKVHKFNWSIRGIRNKTKQNKIKKKLTDLQMHILY